MVQSVSNMVRSAQTTFLIADAQSVKNTDTAKHKGYDAGKKVSGIKRHIAVDTNGEAMAQSLDRGADIFLIDLVRHS